ncbi:MAG: flagellar basal body-associated FliL family protein [Bdellovibrionaceae bacterium]|jgi:flagellar basal body-associated protein FliL|nr:flagellar basal body-associated FliL family protein [Pseudobdellovibrionaceae bacterium]
MSEIQPNFPPAEGSHTESDLSPEELAQQLAHLETWLKEEAPEAVSEIEQNLATGSNELGEVYDDQLAAETSLPWPKRVLEWTKIQVIKTRIQVANLLEQTYVKSRTSVLDFVRWLIAKLSQFKQQATNFWTNLSTKQKVFIFLAAVTLAVIPWGIHKWLLPFLGMQNQGLIDNLTPYATQKIPLDPKGPYESFLRSPRRPPNIFLLPKIVANLASEPDYPKAMIALELSIESLNPQALIFIKEREPFFRDELTHLLNEQLYSELSTAEGKNQLTQKIKELLSTKIPAGNITQVYIRQMILKP